jgi:hypothetical protein
VTARAVLDRAMNETEWQRTVTEYATLRGWLWYHTHDSRRSAAGFPDLVMVRRGRLIFAELKSERGLLRGAQQTWLEALRDCCEGEAYVWRPSDWPRVERILR